MFLVGTTLTVHTPNKFKPFHNLRNVTETLYDIFNCTKHTSPRYLHNTTKLSLTEYMRRQNCSHTTSPSDSYNRSKFAPAADARYPWITWRNQFIPPESTAILSEYHRGTNVKACSGTIVH